MVPWHRSARLDPGDYSLSLSNDETGSWARSKPAEEDSRDVTWEQKQAWFDITSRCEHVLDELLARGVFLPNTREVTNYLLIYPDMIDLLEPICAAVLDRFPPPSQVALELYQDPEIEDEHLTVYIRQCNYDDDILDAIDDIRLELQEARAASSCWIHITTDFEPPI